MSPPEGDPGSPSMLRSKSELKLFQSSRVRKSRSVLVVVVVVAIITLFTYGFYFWSVPKSFDEVPLSPNPVMNLSSASPHSHTDFVFSWANDPWLGWQGQWPIGNGKMVSI